MAKSVDVLLWFSTAMSGIALQLILLLQLLSVLSLNVLRHQQLVIGFGSGCFNASAGRLYSKPNHPLYYRVRKTAANSLNKTRIRTGLCSSEV